MEILSLSEEMQGQRPSSAARLAFGDLARQFQEFRAAPEVWRRIRHSPRTRRLVEMAESVIQMHHPEDRPAPELPANLNPARWNTIPAVLPWYDGGIAGGFRALFCGDTGTGKSTCAWALARRSGLYVVELGLLQINRPGWGAAEAAIAETFTRAHNGLLLIESADVLLPAFAGQDPTDPGTRHSAAVLALVITELDRFQGAVIATSRTPDTIDPAARRRFGLCMRFAPLRPHVAVVAASPGA